MPSAPSISALTFACRRSARVRQWLIEYLDNRISFYDALDEQPLQKINATSAQLLDELWSVVQTRATAQPTPLPPSPSRA